MRVSKWLHFWVNYLFVGSHSQGVTVKWLRFCRINWGLVGNFEFLDHFFSVPELNLCVNNDTIKMSACHWFCDGVTEHVESWGWAGLHGRLSKMSWHYAISRKALAFSVQSEDIMCLDSLLFHSKARSTQQQGFFFSLPLTVKIYARKKRRQKFAWLEWSWIDLQN